MPPVAHVSSTFISRAVVSARCESASVPHRRPMAACDRASNSTRIDSPHGTVSSYVISDIGATPSATWQRAHRSFRIGNTSSLYVNGDVIGLCASSWLRRECQRESDERAAR